MSDHRDDPPPGMGKVIPFPGATVEDHPDAGDTNGNDEDDPDAEIRAAQRELALAHTRRASDLKYANWPRALEHLDEALALDASCTQAWYERALVLRWDHEEALRCYEAALRIEPRFADAYLARGEQYEGREDYPRALADIHRAIQLRPGTIEYSARARVLTKLGRLREAYDDLTRAARRTSHPRAELCERLRVLRAMGDEEATRREIDHLLGQDPSCSAVLRERALLGLRTGDYEDAQLAIDRVVAEERGMPSEFTHMLRADVVIRRGRPGEAVDDLSRAIELCPLGYFFARRADVHAMLGARGRARRDYDRAVEADPHSVDFRLRRARFWMSLGESGALRRALVDVRHCVKSEPLVASHHAEVARVHRCAGRNALARRALARASVLFRRRASREYVVEIRHHLLGCWALAGLDLGVPKPITRRETTAMVEAGGTRKTPARSAAPGR